MNKNTEKNRNNLITKDSLRPACTRSKTPCPIQIPKESAVVQTEPSFVIETIPIPIVKPRCRRQWEQWSWEEKRCFYEGLAEYGKDYGKIQTYMNKKLKLKSYADGKTKEQIRFFYHRTWSKILKTLNLQHEEDTKKACRRELHYLLCLGELRKKRSVGFGAKVMKQLQELATKGLTYIRKNGRNLRVRPPNRYLRKIYKDITDSPEIILPKTVTVEFLPNSNISFNFVQKHAFNPRLRFTGVNINARFSEVFDMLNKRFTDLYINEKLNLYIYPIQSEMNSNFAEALTNAEDRLESYEKTQDTNIVVELKTPEEGDGREEEEELSEEEHKENKEHHELDLHKVLPQIFAMHGEKENNTNSNVKEIVKSFPGHWTYEDAKHVYMRTLFVAFDQKPALKFKYEWKLPIEKKTLTFATASLQYLVNLCESQTQTTQTEVELQSQSPTVAYEQKAVIPGIISSHQNGLIATSNFLLPHRPRPGRKRTASQQANPGDAKSPVIPGTSKHQANKLLKNAVAVNLIPQPPHLVQFAQLPPDSIKLVNTGSAGKGVREEVLSEGFQEHLHFQSLKNIIKSSNLATGESNNGAQNVHIQTTPKKVNPTLKQIPASPNLEWLNETEDDISLTSYLNVCDMQVLQLKDPTNKMQTKETVVKPSIIFHNNNGHVVDPVLPKFESSEMSQGALYDLSFELSNQSAKCKDKFTVS